LKSIHCDYTVLTPSITSNLACVYVCRFWLIIRHTASISPLELTSSIPWNYVLHSP
jgi:hypothetical protein